MAHLNLGSFPPETESFIVLFSNPQTSDWANVSHAVSQGKSRGNLYPESPGRSYRFTWTGSIVGGGDLSDFHGAELLDEAKPHGHPGRDSRRAVACPPFDSLPPSTPDVFFTCAGMLARCWSSTTARNLISHAKKTSFGQCRHVPESQ